MLTRLYYLSIHLSLYLRPQINQLIMPALLDKSRALFVFLFLFRYLRVVVHLIAFCLYKPSLVTANSKFLPSDASIIIPTVDPTDKDFAECLRSIVAALPAAVFVVTAGGHEKLVQAKRTCQMIREQFPKTYIEVISTRVANKRLQVSHAIPLVTTPFTILADDHVFWPSETFLRSVLVPFEEPKVGVVGTNKRVRREQTGFNPSSFWNFIGQLYLERHSHEVCATSSIDGGVFAISGRTSVHRTCILQDQAFLDVFTNERFFFGCFGPLNADDDNFITRWQVKNGWKIKVQHSDEAMIETTLGECPRFLQQALRWARTTFRSNSASLFTDRTVWRTQPWSIYAVYITSFFNYALFYDAALILALTRSNIYTAMSMKCLLFCIFASKLVKPFPHFVRHPSDVLFIPFYIIFIWSHSLLKLYAFLTFWEVSWSGRTLHNAEEGYDSELENVPEKHARPRLAFGAVQRSYLDVASLHQPKLSHQRSWIE